MSKKAAPRARASSRRTRPVSTKADGTTTRSKAPPLPRDVVIDLVLERYAGYRGPDKRLKTPAEGQKWLAARGFSVSENAIAHQTWRAFREGWVEVRAKPGIAAAGQWKRRQDLEDALKRAYGNRGLQSAIIIGGIAPAAKLPSVGDPFYQALGQAMAEQIAKTTLIRSGERIGVGTGRAVYNVVTALEKYAPLEIFEPTLVSLAGNAWQRVESLPRSVDSDFNVTLFRACFSKAEARYIGHPVTDAHSRNNTSLATTKWQNENCPHSALMGVGSLRRNHRFWVSPDGDESEASLDPILVRVKDDLKELARLLINTDQVPEYSPVADVANHFVFVPDADEERKQKRLFDEERIKAKIKELNDKLLSPRDDQFRQIGFIILIAGEVSKALAIRGLIANPDYNVRVLCTDESTAEKLVSLAEQFPLKE